MKTKNQDMTMSSHSFWDITEPGRSEAGRGLWVPCHLVTGAGPLPTEEVGRQATGRLFGGSWTEKGLEQDGEQRGSSMPFTPVPFFSKATPLSLCRPPKHRKQSCCSYSPYSAGRKPGPRGSHAVSASPAQLQTSRHGNSECGTRRKRLP